MTTNVDYPIKPQKITEMLKQRGIARVHDDASNFIAESLHALLKDCGRGLRNLAQNQTTPEINTRGINQVTRQCMGVHAGRLNPILLGKSIPSLISDHHIDAMLGEIKPIAFNARSKFQTYFTHLTNQYMDRAAKILKYAKRKTMTKRDAEFTFIDFF